jgi:hypothetical protein
MRVSHIGVLAGSIFALVVTTTGGCSSNDVVDALDTDSGTSPKPDGSAEGDDAGTAFGDDTGTGTTDTGTGTKDTGTPTKDATTDGPIVLPDGSVDGSVPDSGPIGDGGVCPGAPPTFADLEASGGWKAPPAAATVGACSPANITQFQTNLGTAQTYNDLKTSLPAGCVSCIFSLETSATWSFVVTDAAGTNGFMNYGACYARATTGTDACGKAIQYNDFCLSSSCSACATDPEYATCTGGKQCDANFGAAITSGCPANPAALDAACATSDKAINVLCGTGP